jgi:adenylate cyclase
VLAADVAGYSRLMGADEVGTLNALKTHRREVVDPTITDHNGRIVKTTGDGMLVEFASAVDAVTCAMLIQEKMAERHSSSSGPHVVFRIGINVGDIITDGDDIFGDGVNVAARVENECDPGGVYLSDDAFRQVRGKTAFLFDDLGERTLKNIDRPLRLYAVKSLDHGTIAPGEMASAFDSKKPLPLPDKPSIAVLPFQNMSGDPEQEYFSDGVVEDIITALSRFKSLFVIARNSSFTFKGKVVEIKQVGRELGVRYVLEGSVRKAGGKVRITGQLIDATTGAHLWADRFDGPLDDIFDLQDRVTSSVVAAIAPRLEQAEIDRSERKPTESLDAIDLYYRAAHSYGRGTKQGYEEALQFARQALSLDPNFSAAYGVAAGCYAWRYQDYRATDDEAVLEGKEYALRAVETGPDDAFALTRAAHFFGLVLKDPRTADAIVDQALAVNPNLSLAWRIRGWISVYLGEHERAIDQFQYSMRLNPLDPGGYAAELGLAVGNFFLRRFEIALSWATKSLARQKTPSAGRLAMVSYAMLGRDVDAQMMQRRIREAGTDLTIAQVRRVIPYQRPEDVDLYLEACRIAGVPEGNNALD